MRVKKKLLYYIVGGIVLFAILLLTPAVPMDKFSASIWDIIVKYKNAKEYCSEDMMFAACRAGWFAIIMPVIISIPSMSYVYDEIASGFYEKLQAKKGRWMYIFSNYVYSVISGGVFAFIVLAIFGILVGVVFDSNQDMLVNISGIVVKLSVYAMAFSVLSVFFIFVSKNLSFSISIIFTAGYLVNKVFLGATDIYLSVAMLLSVLCLYIILWRSGRV